MNSPVIEIISSSLPWAWRQLRQYLPLLTLPPLLCAVAAIAWVLLTPPSWKAYQSLLVRDDLLGDNFKPGRFSSLENQKNAQETLLHVARKPEVIRGALQSLGPDKPVAGSPDAWPDEEAVDDIKNAISIVAPNGAEFGKTDVVVLSVKASSRERARKFADLLAGEIELNLRGVRQNQLRSMQTELDLAVQQMQREYELLAQKVKQLELTVGSDLPVLRSLLDRSSSASDVQRALEQIRQERRLAENELEVARKQLELLQAIETDPDQFSVSSSELLAMQPIFKKLREGLTDAELRLMTESGRYEPEHPAVKHAREVIAQTEDQIRHEARAVIQGLQLQTTTAEEKLNRLRASEQQYDQRLVRLGEQRVEYEILAREMEKSGETLGKAKTELAQIQSLADSADQISLITRVGEPQAELRPEGLSKKSMVLLAVLGGLFLGGGLVGLFYRPDPHAPWLANNIARQATSPASQANANHEKRAAASAESFPVLSAIAVAQSVNLDQPSSTPENQFAFQPKFVPDSATTIFQFEQTTTAASADEIDYRQPEGERTSPAEQSSRATAHAGSGASGISEPDLIAVPRVTSGFDLGQSGWTAPQSSAEPGPLTVRSAESESLAGSDRAIGQGWEVPNSAVVASATRNQPSAPELLPRETVLREHLAPVCLPGKIDLVSLKRELAEAAKLASGSGSQDSLFKGAAEATNQVENSRIQERTTGEPNAQTPVTSSQTKPNGPAALTDRLDLLSRSIATFCDAIRIEPPTEGSV